MGAAESRLERGDARRRQILGDDHVNRARTGTTEVDDDFQTFITGAAWADVWSRDGIDDPTRSLVTVALLAALGNDAELELHLRACRRTGATVDQLRDVLLHVAVYAGFPRANAAFRMLRELESEIRREEG